MIKLEIRRFFERFLLFFSVSVLLLCAVCAVYPLISEPALQADPQTSALFSLFAPPPGENGAAFADLFSYFLWASTPLYLFCCLFALLSAACSLSRDESSGMIDFLLSRPVSRAGVYGRRLFGGLLALIAGNAGLFVACVAAFELDGLPVGVYFVRFSLLSLQVLAVEFTFYGVGFLFSALGRGHAASVSMSLSFFAVTAALGALAPGVGLPALAEVSPFHYALPALLPADGRGFTPLRVAVTLSLPTLCLLAGLWRYSKKEFREKRPPRGRAAKKGAPA